MRPFRPEHYFWVAAERIRQAQLLCLDGGSYSLAMYVAGVAVESLLRAFKGRRDTTFDEKHDLRKLFEASGLLQLHPDEHAAISWQNFEEYQEELQSSLTTIYLLWSNDYRFASEARLRSFLKKEHSFRRGVRGDILKALARKLLDAADRLFARGAIVWNRLARKSKGS